MLEALGTALLLGLLSSLHCGGMCGGISGALSLSLPAQVREHPGRLLAYQTLFNLGRITSYAVAGAVVGTLTLALPEESFSAGFAYARVAVGLLMVLLALHLTGVLRSMSFIERMGLGLWRRLTPLYKPLLPARKPHQALALGAFWGWLPCGLVYTALAYSLTVPGTGASAAVMAAFGLGTLPALLLAGSGLSLLRGKLPGSRAAMGVMLLVLGVWTSYSAWPGAADHSAHHGHHAAALQAIPAEAASTGSAAMESMAAQADSRTEASHPHAHH